MTTPPASPAPRQIKPPSNIRTDITNVDELLEIEFAKPITTSSPPTNVYQVQSDLEACPRWILDRLKIETKRRRDLESAVVKLESSLASEKTTFAEWKEKSITIFQQQIAAKDQVKKKFLLIFFFLVLQMFFFLKRNGKTNLVKLLEVKIKKKIRISWLQLH